MKRLIIRITGYALVVAAIAGLIFCVLGVVNIWRYENPILENLTSSLELLDKSLETTAEGLSLAEESLEKATINVTTLENTMLATSRAVNDSTPMVESLIILIEDDIPDTILATQTSLIAAQSSALLIEDVLTAVTSIPFFPGDPYDPPVSLYTSLEQVSESLDPLEESLSSMEDSLHASRGNLIMIQAEINIMARHIGEINESLYTGQTLISQYQEIVANLLERVSHTQSALPEWINILSWSITIFLTWLGITQLGLLLQGLEMAGMIHQESE